MLTFWGPCASWVSSHKSQTSCPKHLITGSFSDTNQGEIYSLFLCSAPFSWENHHWVYVLHGFTGDNVCMRYLLVCRLIIAICLFFFCLCSLFWLVLICFIVFFFYQCNMWNNTMGNSTHTTVLAGTGPARTREGLWFFCQHKAGFFCLLSWNG